MVQVMKRGMVNLSAKAIESAKNHAATCHFPPDFIKKLHSVPTGSEASLEMSEESVNAVLDLLPPPHTTKDTGLKDLSTQLRAFLID